MEEGGEMGREAGHINEFKTEDRCIWWGGRGRKEEERKYQSKCELCIIM